MNYIIDNLLYPQITVNKVIKEDNSVSLQLFLRARQGWYTEDELQYYLQNIRLFMISSHLGSVKTFLEVSGLNRENQLKKVVFSKSTLGFEDFASSFEASFSDISATTSLKNPIRQSGTGSEIYNYYGLGTFDIQQELDQFEANSTIVGASIIPPNEIFQSITINGVFIKDEGEYSSSENFYNSSILIGPNSFLAKRDPAPSKNERKSTAFSNIFPSVTDKKFNFSFFVDTYRLYLNRSEVFASLSDFFQQQALDATGVVDRSLLLYRQRVNTTPLGVSLYNHEKEILNRIVTRRTAENRGGSGGATPELVVGQGGSLATDTFSASSSKAKQKPPPKGGKGAQVPAQTETLPGQEHLFTLAGPSTQKETENAIRLRRAPVLDDSRNSLSNLLYFTCQDSFDSATNTNLHYKYGVEMLIESGVFLTIRDLKEDIRQLDQFKEFMEGIFRTPSFYSQEQQSFVAEMTGVLQRDIKRINSKIGDTPIEEYYSNILKKLILSLRGFEGPLFNRLYMQDIFDTLKKSIGGNDSIPFEKTFLYFFKVYDSVRNILKEILLTDGFHLEQNTKTRTGKIGLPLDKNILKVNNEFSYIFTPSDYKIRYSHIPNEYIVPTSEIPLVSTDNYARVLQSSISKYYQGLISEENFPTTSDLIRVYETNLGETLLKGINTLNYLSPSLIKLGFNEEHYIGLQNNHSWDPRPFMNFALDCIMFNLSNTIPVENSDSLDVKIAKKIKEVMTYYSLAPARDLLTSFLTFGDTLDISLVTEDGPSSDEDDERVFSSDTTSTSPAPLVGNVFLDLLDDFIENYPHLSHQGDYRIKSRTKRSLREAFFGLGNVELPSQLYALYENIVPPVYARPRSTTFSWNSKDILENPINIPVIRLNFANIGTIESLVGFETLQDNTLNLLKPKYKLANLEKVLDNDFGTFLCRIKNYNFKNHEKAWYLDNDNLLSFNYENEHFYMRKTGSEQDSFLRSLISGTPTTVETTLGEPPLPEPDATSTGTSDLSPPPTKTQLGLPPDGILGGVEDPLGDFDTTGIGGGGYRGGGR